MAGAPGALKALVAAMAAGGDAQVNGAVALNMIAQAEPGLAGRVAEEPGALLALVAAMKAGSGAAMNATSVMFTLTNAEPGLARRVGETPGVLPALVAAVAAGGDGGFKGGAGACRRLGGRRQSDHGQLWGAVPNC